MEAASRFGVVLERDEGRSGNGFIVRANIMVSTASGGSYGCRHHLWRVGAPILTGALSF